MSFRIARSTALLCALALALCAAGCGGASAPVVSTDGSPSAASVVESGEQASQSSEAVMVRVTAVDGSTITADLGEAAQGGMPDGQKPDGQAPSGSGQTPPQAPADGQAPSGAPDGQSGMPDGGQKPDGQKPDGGKGGQDQFTSTGKSVTFTIGASTEITGGGKDASGAAQSDIKAGSILLVTLGSDNTALKISILGGGQMAQPHDGGPSSSQS